MLTLTQVWGALLIFTLCPLVGALPLSQWATAAVAGARSPAPPPTAIGVPAAFELSTPAGLLALLLEAAKGIGTVLLARHYFATDPTWEIVALIALVMGRYWAAKAVGTTSVLSGAIAHNPIAAGLTLLISVLGFTIFRERQQGRLLVLILFPVITALSQAQGMQILLTACLSGLIAWIYDQQPEDLALPNPASRLESRRLFGFFRSDRALLSLDTSLDAATVGGKAARLAELNAWGYPVPTGYGLPAGDDPAMLLDITRPSVASPVVVRASMVGDRPALAASAGQYAGSADLTSQEALYAAMNQCFRTYDRPSARQYRRDRGLPDGSLAVVVQQQVQGLCSGVAASRDPFTSQGDAVLIEAVLGPAAQVTAGKQDPERFRVMLQDNDLPDDVTAADSWAIPDVLSLDVQGAGDTPQRLLQEVAFLARHVERRSQGIPQMVEWSFDGDRLWLLHSRPLIPPPSDLPRDQTPALPGTAPSLAAEAQYASSLVGLPVCPGQVRGALRWLKAVPDLRALPPATILVVPYLKASEIPGLRQLGVTGLIAETGGQLSHGAVVAREYGLPTVVLQRGRDRLQSRQTVRLDGGTGTIDCP
ncbi:glycerol-3-phosphate acyltransferase [Halomicronema sp. CCY15110]|uniref:glycerol-3-phosphate acyltransferase n=1 Tax=Halomicronema sp. CCY15110 TaxID=2767773 RepID=UPI0019502113|nr:glycerol-3-phosphate acyltransferase [Halomicronema sp. CCY15110]